MRIVLLLICIGVISFIGCNQSEEGAIPQKSSDHENKQISEPENNLEPENNNIQQNRKVLAKVNGVPIYEDEIKGKTLKKAIRDEALYQDGLRKGLDKEYADQLLRLEKSFISQYNKQLILQEMPQKAITNEDVKIYYHENPDQYTRIYFEEINFPKKSDAENIIKMIEEGKSFEAIAQKFKDAGVVYDKTEDRNLEQYFNKKEVGEVSDIIEKPNDTYSILKIYNIYTVPYNHVAPSIKHMLNVRQAFEAIDNYINNLEDKKEIEIVYLNGEQKEGK